MTRNTRTLLVVALVLLAFEVVTLVRRLSASLPSDGSSADRDPSHAIAEISRVSQSVKIRPIGSLSWQRAETREPVFSRDAIMTGAQSESTIQLKSGGEVIVGPNTLIRFPSRSLGFGKSPYVFELAQGSVSIRSTQTPLQIKMADKTVSINPNSAVKFRQNPGEKDSEAEIITGAANLDGVPIKTAATSHSLQHFASAPVMKTPIARKLFRSEVEPFNVYFSWQSDGPVRLQISRQEGFREFTEFTTSENNLTVPLSAGHYYWRLGQKEHFGTKRPFSIEVTHPKQIAKNLFRFERARPKKQEKSKPTVIAKKDPPLWTRFFEKNPPESPEQLAKNESDNTQPPPAETAQASRSLQSVTSLEAVASRTSAQASNKAEESYSLDLKWNSVQGASAYSVEIAPTSVFSKKLYEFIADSNSTRVNVVLSKNVRYYYRVKVLDSVGQVASISDPTLIKLPN